jgi:hypothetical protein
MHMKRIAGNRPSGEENETVLSLASVTRVLIERIGALDARRLKKLDAARQEENKILPLKGETQ